VLSALLRKHLLKGRKLVCYGVLGYLDLNSWASSNREHPLLEHHARGTHETKSLLAQKVCHWLMRQGRGHSLRHEERACDRGTSLPQGHKLESLQHHIY
jgi:hypothetical protein